MKITHTQKFIRTSPRKLREVADIVRKLEPNRAVEVLPFTNRRAAMTLQKVIKTAIANATNSGVTGEMFIKDIQVGEGPRLKRGRAASRGRWQPFKRKMSHVRIVLESREVKQNAISKIKKEIKTTEKETDEKEVNKKTVTNKTK